MYTSAFDNIVLADGMYTAVLTDHRGINTSKVIGTLQQGHLRDLVSHEHLNMLPQCDFTGALLADGL